MKKIFTLCMGVLIALSAVAAPQFNLRKTTKLAEADAEFVPVMKAAVQAPAKLADEVVVVEANNLMVSESDYSDLYYQYYNTYAFSFQGYNEEWAIVGTLFTGDSKDYFQEYTADDIELYALDMLDNQEQYGLLISTAKLEQLAEGPLFTATAQDTALGRTFDIKLSFFAPAKPKDTVDHVFTTAPEVVYYGDTHDYYINIKDDDFVASFDIYTDDLAGEYTADDFEQKYSWIQRIVGADTLYVGSYYSLDAKVTEGEDAYTFDINYFASGDSINYHFVFNYAKPVATDTVQVVVDSAMFADYTETAGFYRIMATPKDNPDLTVALGIISEQLAGNFTEKELYPNYTAVIVGEEQYSISQAELSATVLDGKLLLTGAVLAANSTRYELTITAVLPSEEAIDNVEAAQKAVKRIENGQLIIEKNDVRYNAQGAVIR